MQATNVDMSVETLTNPLGVKEEYMNLSLALTLEALLVGLLAVRLGRSRSL